MVEENSKRSKVALAKDGALAYLIAKCISLVTNTLY